MSLGELGELPALVQQAEAQEKARLSLVHPGFYEHAQNELKRVLTPDIFDGCRVEVHKPLGSKFATSHTIWIGSTLIPNGIYQFGANAVIGSDLNAPDTLLSGRITPDGRLDARWHQNLNKQVTLRIQSQLSSEAEGLPGVIDVDYVGSDFGVNMKCMPGPLFGLSYFQSITNALAMGGEGYYAAEHNKSILSYCARYTTPDWMGIATYGSIGTLHLHYMRKLSDRVKLASELVYNNSNGESTANVGAEFTLRQSRFLTNVDHTGKISSTIEAQLGQGVTMLMSAEGAPARNEFKFGYGLNFAPQYAPQ